MEGISVKVRGNIIDFDNAIKALPKVERYAIWRAADTVISNIKDTLSRKYPSVNNSNNKYNDRMIDAIRMSKIAAGKTKVHAYGSRETGSGTYRTRFLAGTKFRYQKNPRRFLGRIPESNWFESGVSSAREAAISQMEQVLDKYIDRMFS